MATIQGVYVALFGRPADPTGLAYFEEVTKGGQDLTAIGDLAATAEFKTRFEGQNNVQIVNSIYKSLFNRDSDLAGLNFFVNKLNAGELTINNIAIAILDGATGADKTIVENKIKAANAYTDALDTGTEVVAYSGATAADMARAYLAGVTTTASIPTKAQTDAAVKAMVERAPGGGTGETGFEFYLSAGDNILSPNSPSATSKTTANNDVITGRAAGDLASTDIIDAGDGNDTLNAKMLVNSAAAVKPLLKSVENVNLEYGALAAAVAAPAPGTPAGIASFDAADSTGIVKFTASKIGIGEAANTVSLTNFEKSTVVAIKDISVTAGVDGKANVSFRDTNGASDAATVSLEKVTLGGGASLELTVNAIEKLTLNSTGDVNTVALIANTAKDLVLTGDKKLVLDATGTTAVKTVDASGLSASLDYKAGAKGETITGTAKADVIALGAGEDVIVFNSANVSKLAAADEITGFNAGNDTTTVDKIDLKAFGLESVTIGTTAVAVGGDIEDFFSTDNVVFNDASDMLFVDVNGDGHYTAGSDLAVKLAGVNSANLNAGDFILA